MKQLLLLLAAAGLQDGQAACTIEAARAGTLLPFGCATALNLEAMRNGPADIAPEVLPQGAPAIRAIMRHRDGNTPPLPPSSSTEAPGQSGDH